MGVHHNLERDITCVCSLHAAIPIHNRELYTLVGIEKCTMLRAGQIGLPCKFLIGPKSSHQRIFRAGLYPRSFHATPRPQLLDTCISQTHTIITSLHSLTGLPWILSLPLTALCVRGVLILPIALYANNTRQRMLSLSPIISAWSHIIRARVFKENVSLGPVACHKLLTADMFAKSKEIYKDFGIRPWTRFLTWLQLPVWLVVIETIRKMCGTNQGLLGLVLGPSKTLDDNASREDVIAAASLPSIPIEQSLSMEGGLWFPDLLMPDPQLLLSVALTMSLFANIQYQVAHSRSIGAPQSTWSLRLVRISRMLALAIGPLTLQVPSAMLIYWLSSSLFGLLQNVIIDRYFSKTLIIKPCKSRSEVRSTGT